MAIIKSDILLYGKHGKILRSLVDTGLFDSGAEGFVVAVTTGIYYGKKAEPENTQDDEIQVSRVYFQKRRGLENVLFTLLQHEKVYQKRPLTATEVFLYEDYIDEDTNLLEELKSYALYGLEVLSKEYDSIIGLSELEDIVEAIVDEDLKTKDELNDYVQNDDAKNVFYKSFEDKEISAEVNEIMDIYEEG